MQVLYRNCRLILSFKYMRYIQVCQVENDMAVFTIKLLTMGIINIFFILLLTS